MAKWYDQWLTERERNNLQVGQKGIRARRRKQEDEANRGYPRSSIPISQPSMKTAEKNIEARKAREQEQQNNTRQAIEKAFKKGK